MGSLHNVREDYLFGELTEKTVNSNPYLQVEEWLEQAKKQNLIHWNAMTLATADKDGFPSARTVLLKESSERGFIFFTNYDSQKGTELISNPKATLLFYFREMERQIKIAGTITKLSYEESHEYFKTRPLGSQISASISAQSKVVKGREELEDLYHAFEKKYENKEIPCPKNWGGFLLKPSYFEFWQGRKNRLHDRLRFRPENNQWKIERLAP